MANEFDIHKLPVQDPPCKEFSSSHLTWYKCEGHHHTVDEIALIPYARVEGFLKGESDNVECPTRFRIEGGRKNVRFSSTKQRKPADYSEFRLYWCAFGPDNYGESGTVLPSKKFRTGGRKRAVRPQAMRGCMCHFIIKRLFVRPHVAVIVYNQRQHVDNSGTVCHGPLDRNALGPRTMTHPYVSDELRQQAMSMIYLGISEENILQKYIEGAEAFGGSGSGGDLASKYVQKLEVVIKRSTYELDPDDLSSVRIWVERHPKNVFFYQDSSDTGSFILGIQTEWQLQQMIRFGNNSLVAADTTFGINKLKVPITARGFYLPSYIFLSARERDKLTLTLSFAWCSILCTLFLSLIQTTTHSLLHGLLHEVLQVTMFASGPEHFMIESMPRILHGS